MALLSAVLRITKNCTDGWKNNYNEQSKTDYPSKEQWDRT